MQGIISRRNGFLGRNAFLIYIVILATIGSVCWTIRYPEIARCEGVLTKDIDDRNFVVKLAMSNNLSGSFESNFSLQLRFKDYPYREFGILENLSNVLYSKTADSIFIIVSEIPQTPMTTKYHLIKLEEGMIVDVLVLTKDARLIKRFFKRIREMLH
jgi:hypothetical protein